MSSIVLRVCVSAALCCAGSRLAFAESEAQAKAQTQAKTSIVLPEVTVTATREATLMSETPSAVGLIDRAAIGFTRPSHPQQLLGQIPGVAVAVTNGEGHTTAIRQGFTTSPLYLFLEDGIPIRATGNFNHNALYELNIPSAGGVEVVRGIGSALYGSDAIGGTINVLTRTPKEKAGSDLSLEGGSAGWARLLGGIDSGRMAQSAVRADINLTHTDGWRDRTAYDRQSVNLRWDYEQDDRTLIKTILGATHIDQQTGANSALPLALYLDDPTTNLRSVAYRKLDAFRLSSAIEKELGQGQQVSITPYFRDNRMDLNGSYNFSSNSSSARIEKTAVQSFGLMLKYRKNFDDAWRTRLIAGLDFDYSPSQRRENKITLTSTGTGLYTNYTGYSIGKVLYDYEVTYQSLAPYLHAEISPVEQVRLTAGLRYDQAHYAMNNALTAGANGGGSGFYQLADTSASFSRLSPKLGATWTFSESAHVFTSYNQGFRTPSENQLFRAGASNTTQASAALGLNPILAEQYELGLRGNAEGWRYEAVAYQLTKRDDLLSQKDASNVVVQTNNGATRHQGLELGLGRQFARDWRIDWAGSYAVHRYLEWSGTSSSNVAFDYAGKDIEAAPRFISNLRLGWTPAPGSLAQLEWVKLGAYPLDANNQYGNYDGHDVFNLRLSQALDARWTVFARVINLADTRYADSASASSSGALYSPALPRSAYLGLEGTW
jgi:outer membrane receptor protein involved in Fe transport